MPELRIRAGAAGSLLPRLRKADDIDATRAAPQLEPIGFSTLRASALLLEVRPTWVLGGDCDAPLDLAGALRLLGHDRVRSVGRARHRNLYQSGLRARNGSLLEYSSSRGLSRFNRSLTEGQRPLTRSSRKRATMWDHEGKGEG